MSHKDNVKKLYADWSGVYDQSSENSLSVLVEKGVLIEAVNPKEGEAILDLGCGTGRITAQIFEFNKTVVGVDLSDQMLEVARKKLPEASFIQADILSLPFADNSFDKVVSSLVFQFLPDIEKPLKEVSRVLNPGGTLFITDFIKDAPLDWSNVKYQKEKIFKGSIGELSKFRSAKEYEETANLVGLKLMKMIPLRVRESAKELLTENSWNEIQGSFASVIFVFKNQK